MIETIQQDTEAIPRDPRSFRYSFPQLAQLASSCIWCLALATKFIGSKEEREQQDDTIPQPSGYGADFLNLVYAK